MPSSNHQRQYDGAVRRTSEVRADNQIVYMDLAALGVNRLRAISRSRQNKVSYRHSPVIESADWDFKHLIRLANTPGKGGSDLWPATWAADGSVYAG
jgi:hypothetical protein